MTGSVTSPARSAPPYFTALSGSSLRLAHLIRKPSPRVRLRACVSFASRSSLTTSAASVVHQLPPHPSHGPDMRLLLVLPLDLLHLHLLPHLLLTLTTPDLRSLAATCSSLLTLLRPSLFATLFFQPNFSSLTRASHVLSRPHLARHIRIFHLRPLTSALEQRRGFPETSDDVFDLDLAFCDALEQIAPTSGGGVLAQVEEIVLLTKSPEMGLLRWLLEEKRSPALRRVRIEGLMGREGERELVDMSAQGRRDMHFVRVGD